MSVVWVLTEILESDLDEDEYMEEDEDPIEIDTPEETPGKSVHSPFFDRSG